MLVTQVRAGGGHPRIFVVDASSSPRNESKGRTAVSSIHASTGYDIAFIGRGERQALRRSLARICGHRLAEFALRPGASGNRNVILLLTAGEQVLLVDDDVVCEVWEPRSLRLAIDLCGHTEERNIAFYQSRAEVLKGLEPASVNLLAAHEAVLGRTVKSLAASRSLTVNASRACAHLREGIRNRRTARVRMTFNGLAGDSGIGYPDRLLFSTGTWKAVLENDSRAFALAFKFREVCKVADRYVVMHEVSCMSGCMGLSNTTIVPPFLPTGRNEDGLFGYMLSAIDRATVSSHLPFAVVHDSARPPRYPDERFRSASETRVADLLILLTNVVAPSIRVTEPRRRLARLAEWLRVLSSLKGPEFVSAVSAAILTARSKELSAIATALEPGSTCPRHWQRDLRTYRRALLKSVEDPRFLLPIEFHGAPSLDAGYRELQRFVRLSADLLGTWPSLWDAASESLA